MTFEEEISKVADSAMSEMTNFDEQNLYRFAEKISAEAVRLMVAEMEQHMEALGHGTNSGAISMLSHMKAFTQEKKI